MGWFQFKWVSMSLRNYQIVKSKLCIISFLNVVWLIQQSLSRQIILNNLNYFNSFHLSSDWNVYVYYSNSYLIRTPGISQNCHSLMLWYKWIVLSTAIFHICNGWELLNWLCCASICSLVFRIKACWQITLFTKW